MTGFARSVTSLQVHASATARLRRHVRILRQDRCLRGIHAFYAHLVAALQGSTCWRSKAIAQTGGPQCDCCRSTTTLGAAAPGQWPGLAVRAVHRHRASASRPVSPRRCSSASAGVSAGSWRRHAATSHVRALPSTSALCASPRLASLRATVESPVGQLRLCRIARCRLLLGDLGAPWLGCHARTVVTGQRAGFFSSVLVHGSEAMPRRLRRMLLHPTFKTLKNPATLHAAGFEFNEGQRCGAYATTSSLYASTGIQAHITFLSP